MEINKKVRNYLIELSRKKFKQTVTYQKLSDDCKLDLNMQENPSDRTYIGEILGLISTFEHENNRPLLSALVIRASDDYEGDGFYKLAEQLGFGNWKRLKKEGIFEAVQIKKCINFWENEQNHKKYKIA